jgi:hypothetical protein
VCLEGFGKLKKSNDSIGILLLFFFETRILDTGISLRKLRSANLCDSWQDRLLTGEPGEELIFDSELRGWDARTPQYRNSAYWLMNPVTIRP